ncbi:glycosyltransferase [Streptomyces sp. NPDC058964]|uniref:glycosyltransferase n=1 Tax=Streptomyces sp. NPDC058964 TaxID=3346681 RepID=UPI00369309CE
MNQNLRVAHVGNFKPESANGVDSAVVGLTRHLSTVGVDVQIWNCSKRVTTLTERWVGDGIKIYDIPKFPQQARNAIGLPRRSWEAVGQLARSVDLLHFHSVYTAENIALSRLGVPYVVTPHGGYNPNVTRGRRRFAKAVWRALWETGYLRRAEALHAVSEGEVHDLEALELGRRIACMPNGLDERWQEELVPAPADGPWVFLGRLDVKVKGLDLLLDGYAGALRASAVPDLLLVGPDHRGGESWLRQRISELNLNGNVAIRPPVFGAAKMDLLRSASAVLQPSRWEGLPFAVLEALAVGRPVLVTPGTNMAHPVVEYDAGVAVDANAAAIADGLSELVERGAAWRTAAGKRAQSLIGERFTWGRVASQMAALYREVVT